MKKSTRNGFTLLDSLLAMLITSIVSLCMVVFFKTCLGCLQMRTSHQDQMAILQMREMAALSHSLHVEEEKLYMIYENQKIEVSFEKHRIVRKKGYEILMEHVDRAYFIEKDEGVYLYYEKENVAYQMQIN